MAVSGFVLEKSRSNRSRAALKQYQVVPAPRQRPAISNHRRVTCPSYFRRHVVERVETPCDGLKDWIAEAFVLQYAPMLSLWFAHTHHIVDLCDMFCPSFRQDSAPNTPDLQPVEGAACKAARAGEGAESHKMAELNQENLEDLEDEFAEFADFAEFGSSLILSDLSRKPSEVFPTASDIDISRHL